MSTLRVAGAALSRDVFVTGREVGSFLAQTLIQPFFLLFVFGKVLGELGYVRPGYESVLLPGLVALNGFLIALQNTALPLVVDFSYTKEIEDRLLAPLPVPALALEKIVFGALRGLVAALFMIPVGLVVLGGIDWDLAGLPAAALVLVVGSVAGASVGMTLGTSVSPRRINILFATVIVPVTFTGAIQFPWLELAPLRWFQVVCALNPLTYVSEGMRSVLVPSVPHLSWSLCVALLVLSIAVFASLGVRGFLRRALD